MCAPEQTERHSENEINGPIRSTDQTQRREEKRGRFRIKRNYSLHCSFGCLLTRFDAEEPRNGLFSDDTNLLFSSYVMKTLWSNRIVLGNEEEKKRNYDIKWQTIRNIGRMSVKLLGTQSTCAFHMLRLWFVDISNSIQLNSPVNWVVITATILIRIDHDST